MSVYNPADRGRRCALWISWLVPAGGTAVLLDTRTVADDDPRRGPDAWPADTLLVLLHPSDAERLRTSLSPLVGEEWAVVAMIDKMVASDPDLNAKIGWRR